MEGIAPTEFQATHALAPLVLMVRTVRLTLMTVLQVRHCCMTIRHCPVKFDQKLDEREREKEEGDLICAGCYSLSFIEQNLLDTVWLKIPGTVLLDVNWRRLCLLLPVWQCEKEMLEWVLLFASARAGSCGLWKPFFVFGMTWLKLELGVLDLITSSPASWPLHHQSSID